MFAWAVISIAKMGFLVQYYVLICLLLVKNLIRRVFSKTNDKKQSIFSHPQHSVHPHILLSTRTLLIKNRRFYKARIVYIINLRMPNWGWSICYIMAYSPRFSIKKKQLQPDIDPTRAFRLLDVMVPPRIEVRSHLIKIDYKPFRTSSLPRVTTFGWVTIVAPSTQTVTATNLGTGSSTWTISSNTTNLNWSIRFCNRAVRISWSILGTHRAPRSFYSPSRNTLRWRKRSRGLLVWERLSV